MLVVCAPFIWVRRPLGILGMIYQESFIMWCMNLGRKYPLDMGQKSKLFNVLYIALLLLPNTIFLPQLCVFQCIIPFVLSGPSENNLTGLFTPQLLVFWNFYHGEHLQKQERQQDSKLPLPVYKSQSRITKPCSVCSAGEVPVPHEQLFLQPAGEALWILLKRCWRTGVVLSDCFELSGWVCLQLLSCISFLQVDVD